MNVLSSSSPWTISVGERMSIALAAPVIRAKDQIALGRPERGHCVVQQRVRSPSLRPAVHLKDKGIPHAFNEVKRIGEHTFDTLPVLGRPLNHLLPRQP